jgi:hypothetical protein
MVTIRTVHLHVRDFAPRTPLHFLGDFATKTPLHFLGDFATRTASTLLREILQHGSKPGALFSLFPDSLDLKIPVGKQSRMNIIYV